VLQLTHHRGAARRSQVVTRVASVEKVETVTPGKDDQRETLPTLEDPWEDPKWTQYKWTVYRGEAYDLTKFIDRHPAGSWLINLSLGRDCTALFESYHLRPDVAVARLRMLPKIPDFPVEAVPPAPRPNDSDLYNSIRERVRNEVFKGQVRHMRIEYTLLRVTRVVPPLTHWNMASAFNMPCEAMP
jgi:acyl-lipid (7-3)-desaturase (Delta-4 desaturase)